MESNIIEEQLINFDTAKLAKEKGFDLLVNRTYNKTEKLDPFDEYDASLCNYNEWNNFTSAPTQSLLQKWLREKYRKHIDVNPFYYKGDFISWNLRIHNTYYKDKYNSYEEALEIGLQEVLKLI